MIWKRETDPNIPVGLDGESYGDLLYNMLEYENIYFSRNAYAAKLYIGENGLFLLVPTSASDLLRDEKEKTRLKKALVEIKEALGAGSVSLSNICWGSCRLVLDGYGGADRDW